MENPKKEKTKDVMKSEFPNHVKDHPNMTEEDYHICDEYSAEHEYD